MSRNLRTVRLNAAPKIDKRPRCPQCGDRLRPLWSRVNSKRIEIDGKFSHYQNIVEWRGEYHGYGAFCTQSCGVAYANERVNNPPRLRVGAISDAELNNISERITMDQVDELQSRLP